MFKRSKLKATVVPDLNEILKEQHQSKSMNRTSFLRVGNATALVVALAIGVTGVAQASDYQMPRLMAIGTAGTSGGSFASTNGWASVFQQDTGVMTRVIPEDNEAQRYRRLIDRKEFKFISTPASEVRYQTLGLGRYASTTPAEHRVLWHHNDTPWGFVVSGDSSIETMDDLRERGGKISLGVQNPTMVTAVQSALPAFLGFSEEEKNEKLQYVPTSSYAENCRSVVEGRADVAYCTPTSSVLAEMEGAPGGIRWLSMDLDDLEAWSGFLNHRPMIIPARMELGVSSARNVEGFISNFLYVVPADADKDFAYNMAKWFHESYEKYKSNHILASRMSVDNFREYLNRSPLPVHEGTVLYLKEIGQWTEEDDVWNNEAIEKMNLWVQARTAALEEARSKDIQVSDQNEEFMAIMKRHTEGLEDFRSRL